MDTVYLLHFDRKIGCLQNPRGTAQHYIGFTTDLEKRLDQHRNGRSGAGIVTEFYRQGIEFVLARTWEGGRCLERKLKNRHNASQLCPICNKKAPE